MLSTRSVFTLSLSLLGTPALAPAVECSEVKSHDLRFIACRVDLRADHLQLFLYDERGKAFNSFQRVAQSLVPRNEQLTFAMNGGMYREDFSPVGLMVTGGRQIHRLNLATGYGNFYIKPNGVFMLSEAKARIVETTEYRNLGQPGQLAMQSGPLLVQDGQINPTLNPHGFSRLIRNGVGVSSPDHVVFAISQDTVTFYEFAQMFKESLRCTDALYLDGTVSSLYFPSQGRDDAYVPLGPIFAVTVAGR